MTGSSAMWNFVDHDETGEYAGLHVSSDSIDAYFEPAPRSNVRDICGTADTNLFGTVKFRARTEDNSDPSPGDGRGLDKFGLKLTDVSRPYTGISAVIVSTRVLAGGHIELHKPSSLSGRAKSTVRIDFRYRSCSALSIAEISAFSRANAPRTFTLPDQVAWVMKDQVVIGVARVDVVLDFVTLHRSITHRTRVSRGAATGVDQPNERYRQATFVDALLDAHSQLALRQDCLGMHTLPVPPGLIFFDCQR